MITNLYVMFESVSPSADLVLLAGHISVPGYSFSTKPEKQTIRVPGSSDFPVACFFYAQNYFRIFISQMAVEFCRGAAIPSELAAGEKELYRHILETKDFSVQRWLATSEGWDDGDQPFVNTVAEGTSAHTFPIFQ